MSKGGGAGKVYFVLYLAVVLELLIIIVERDEAEEGLMKKQKETMKIVESILSQLQSGAGTEGINTRPQDEITLPPPGIDIKQVMGADIKTFRRYIVEVGVTDISAALTRKEGESEKEYVQRLKKLIELGNVEEIEYQIFFNPSEDPNNAPNFLSEEQVTKQKIDFTSLQPGYKLSTEDGIEWEFLAVRKLSLDKEATFNGLNLENLKPESIHPIYPKEKETIVGNSYSPREVTEDSVFFYSEEASFKNASSVGGQELQKRAFVVNFQPPDRAGWYKLRFGSRTNRILGVRKEAGAKPDEELDDETTVNIGTVQLTVKDLRKVKKELESKLEKYRMPNYDQLVRTGDIDAFDEGLKIAVQDASKADDAADIISKIRLYGYIAKLLAPGMSSNFSQNRGAIEFNVRVITPRPPIAEPTVTLTSYNAGFDKVPAAIEFQISPYQGETNNVVSGKIVDASGTAVARLDIQPLDRIAGMNVAPPVQGGRREFRGLSNTNLAPGKYKIEITHTLGGKSKSEQGDLEIFATGLTKESRNSVESRIQSLALYGYPVSVEAIPTSGGKIKPNQFRLYLYTDNNNQPVPIEGLTNTDNPLKMSCDAKRVNLRLTWIQPFTMQEVDIYPLKSFDIKQEEPQVSVSGGPEFSGNANKFKVRVSGITIDKPTTGCGDAVLKVKLGKPEKVEGLKTHDLSIEPTLEQDGENYTLILEFQGKLERGERRITGTINIPVLHYAINPNGVQSDEQEYTYPLKVNWEPGQGDRRRPQR